MYLLEKLEISQIAEKLNTTEENINEVLKKFKRLNRSKGEMAMREVLAIIYPQHKIEEQVPIGTYYMDFYIDKLRLCFEYDGIQHFDRNTFYHGEGNSGQYKFERQQYNDGAKNKLADLEYIYIIRIPYNEKTDETNIRRIINEHYPKIMDNLAAYSASIGF